MEKCFLCLDKMLANIFIIAVITACQQENAADPRIFVSQDSQVRLPGETFDDAENRYRSRLSPLNLNSYLNLHSVKNIAGTLEELDFSDVPTWSAEDLASGFDLVRDKQFLDDSSHGGLRRSTWLYPDDGCFARGDLMIHNLKAELYPVMKKIFVFGPLIQATANNVGGVVYWWYHTAPLVEVEGSIYIMDPATDPSGVQLLAAWIDHMADDTAALELAICSTSTYGPFSQCLNGANLTDAQAKKDQLELLDLEWARLLELGRSPEEELGANPPWL